MPVEVEIFDARDLRAQVASCACRNGFAELNSKRRTNRRRAYRVEVYLLRNGKRDALLGSGDFHSKNSARSDEDRVAAIAGSAARWIDPKDVQAFVTLRNLYGTPASSRALRASSSSRRTILSSMNSRLHLS